MMKFGSRCHISGPLIYNLKFVIKTASSIGAILVLANFKGTFHTKKGTTKLQHVLLVYFLGVGFDVFSGKKIMDTLGNLWWVLPGFDF